MKKLAAVIMSAAMLCACGSEGRQGEKAAPREWRMVSQYDMSEYERGGCFVSDGDDMLEFLDFSSALKTPVCDDPTCTHTKDEGCTAFGKTNHPFIYGEKLYYFKSTDFVKNSDETYSAGCELWQSDLNGKSEKKVCEFPKYQFEPYNRLLLRGSCIYMTMSEAPYDRDFNALAATVRLVRCDLEKGSSEDAAELVSGYSVGASIGGVWNGKLILTATKPEVNKPFMERFEEYKEKNGLTEKEAWKTFAENEKYVTAVYEFDEQSKKLTESKLPAPVLITETAYYYSDGETIKYLDRDGREKSLGKTDTNDSIRQLGGYVSYSSGGVTYLLDESSGEEIKLNGSYDILFADSESIIYRMTEDPKFIEIDGETVVDGNYIPKTEYIKKSIKELRE